MMSAMIGAFAGSFVSLVFLAGMALFLWQLITEIRRVARGVEDIAEVLRRMESAERLFNRPPAQQPQE